MSRKHLTQKQRVQRNAWALLLLCTLLALLSSNLLELFPHQAIRYEEVYAGLGETRIIAHLSAKHGEYYLSANETTLLVSPLRRGWRTPPHQKGNDNVGWQGWSEASACDLSRQKGPFYSHRFSAVLDGEDWSITHIYGRVDVEGAWAVRARNDDLPALAPQTQTLTRGKDRHLYFWFLTQGTRQDPAPVYTDFTVLDRDGNAIGEYHAADLHPFLYI